MYYGWGENQRWHEGSFIHKYDQQVHNIITHLKQEKGLKLAIIL